LIRMISIKFLLSEYENINLQIIINKTKACPICNINKNYDDFAKYYRTKD